MSDYEEVQFNDLANYESHDTIMALLMTLQEAFDIMDPSERQELAKRTKTLSQRFSLVSDESALTGKDVSAENLSKILEMFSDKGF